MALIEVKIDFSAELFVAIDPPLRTEWETINLIGGDRLKSSEKSLTDCSGICCCAGDEEERQETNGTMCDSDYYQLTEEEEEEEEEKEEEEEEEDEEEERREVAA